MKVAVRMPRSHQHANRSPSASRRPSHGSNESSARPLAAPPVHPTPNSPPLSTTGLQTGRDKFQFNSLLAQICLIQLFKYTEDQYSARNSGGHRPVQNGYAWRIFSSLFAQRDAIQSVRIFEHLLQFANDESHALSRSFFLAYAPLSFEHDETGEYIGPGVWTPESGSRIAAVRVRRTLKRWCEWLEALAHFRVHQSRLHSSQVRPLDKAVIFLWPLHRRHQWSDDELLHLLRRFLHRGNAYPCGSVAQLASYCRGVLGLRSIKTATEPARSVPGQTVAERVLRFLPAIQ